MNGGVGEVRISANYGHLHIEAVEGNVPAAIAEFERLEGWLLERGCLPVVERGGRND